MLNGILVPVPASFGYPLLGALVLGESMGLPLPGETALISEPHGRSMPGAPVPWSW